MTVFFPVFELIDRLVIAEVKFEKTQGANRAELEFYQQQAQQFDLNLIADETQLLKQIHKQIWLLEAELKSGRESELGLEELGRRAIEIRNWNNRRIAIKNSMADKLGQGYLHELKKDHISE
jgi:hypothetical protein